MTAETSPTRRARDLAGAYTNRKLERTTMLPHKHARRHRGEVRYGKPTFAQMAAAQRGRSCILCDALPAPYTGVFLPANPQQFGMEPGQEGLFTYSVCKTCVRLADAQERAVQRILQDIWGTAGDDIWLRRNEDREAVESLAQNLCGRASRGRQDPLCGVLCI